MASETKPFAEAHLWKTPIRDLHLTLAGTRLEPIVARFEQELQARGITKVRPRFYLSTEWGVPFDTIAIAIPFYLARPDLTALHEQHVGHVEGFDPDDVLRYLRHEMGHVVNYAYQLYEDPEWVSVFGSISQPYEEDYRPRPFDRRFVLHLPGWYAQKHPDEDWSETFAVWMTPNLDWRAEYADWPQALAKLEYCDRTLKELVRRDPLVTDNALDEDVGDLEFSLEKFYDGFEAGRVESLPGVDGALRTVFAGPGEGPPASALMGRLEVEAMASVYRWTGHFPERTRVLLRHLAARADALGLTCPPAREAAATVGLTTLVTALAMNFIQRGGYTP